MKKSIVITINRQYGSGGHLIGKKVAEKLGIPFYDKELLTLAASESGFAKETFEHNDEHVRLSTSYLSAIGVILGSPTANLVDLSLNDQLQMIQSKVIEEIANKGSCVIVGRCADYVLRDRENLLSIYIHADDEDRTLRIVNEYQACSEEEAEAMIKKMDKQRSNYYNFYSNQKWNSAKTYDLTLNSSYFGIEGCVDLICEVAKRKSV